MGIVTALNPYIGYSSAAEVAKESLQTGESIREIVLKKGLMSEEKLNEILSPESMTKPGVVSAREMKNN
jgi:aspartate ammonia-lyase